MEHSNLTLVEEFDITNSLTRPHLMYHPITMITKKRVAVMIASREPELLLIMSLSGFESSAVFAGLNEKQIEYIAQNAPREYKEAVLSVLGNSFILDEAFEIAKELDDDMGGGSSVNRERLINVVQYLKNNNAAFKF